MTKYFFTIKRHNGAAYVEIHEATITPTADGGSLHRFVTGYETASIGATASARKTIKSLEENRT